MVGRIRETFGEQEPRNLIESEIKNLNTETEKLLKKGKISELQAQKRKLGSEITEERVAAVKFTRKRKAKK